MSLNDRSSSLPSANATMLLIEQARAPGAAPGRQLLRPQRVVGVERLGVPVLWRAAAEAVERSHAC